MNDQQIKSWIFLAISVVSQDEPADFAGISMMADGINHAVPTHKEMQSSISYLITNELVEKKGNKYALTSKGKLLMDTAGLNQNGYWEIWKELETLI